MTLIRKIQVGGVACALCLLCGVAGAQNPKTQIGAENYLSLCRQYSVVSGAANPNPAGSAAMELRGNIAGIAESGDGFIVLLKFDDGSTTNLVGSGPAPTFSVGTRVRVLLKSQAATNDSGEVNLLAITSEGEAAADQLARKPKSAPAYAGRKKTVPDGYSKKKKIRARKVPLTDRSFTGVRPAPSTAAQEVLTAYKNAIRYFNRRGSDAEVDRIARAVLNYSIEYQVDARLVMAIFAVESNFNPRATSRVGASGLGQLMPGTAAGLGVRNIYDIEENVRGAVMYIRDQLNRYEGKDDWTRLQLTLAAYNAGPGAVKKYGGKVPPYRETQAYVRKVSAWFLHFLGEKP